MTTNWLRRLALFFGIVWRDYHGARMTARCAWDVARAMYPAPGRAR
jgi:hypothetical protein